MKTFLKVAGFDSLSDLTRNYKGSNIPNKISEEFMNKPEQITKELFTFIATQPRRLGEIAQDLLNSLETSETYEKEEIDLLKWYVLTLHTKVDEFTKWLAKAAHWTSIYPGTLDVTTVWRTREDSVAGGPTNRAIPSRDLPGVLASLAVLETDDTGLNNSVVLSLSDARYRRGDTDEHETRQDFLVKLPEMYCHPKVAKTKPGLRASSESKACDLFKQTFFGSIPLISCTVGLASFLNKYRYLPASDSELFGLRKVGSGLKSEENPNAKYEIGGWA